MARKRDTVTALAGMQGLLPTIMSLVSTAPPRSTAPRRGRGPIRDRPKDKLKPFVYQPLNAATDEIRLVRLQPDCSKLDLGLDIYHVPIRDAPTFKAISYAWGGSSGGTNVRFNEGVRKVNDTVYLFLLQAMESPEDAQASYWIDAICIDQRNVAERNEQVLRMKEIYEAATQIVVWLGQARLPTPVATQSAASLDDLMLTGMKASPDIMQHNEGIDDNKSALVVSRQRKDPAKLEPRALATIYRCSWWERAWIIQEASTPVVENTPLPNAVWVGPLRYDLDACLRASATFHNATAGGDEKYRVPTMVDDLAWIRAHRSNAESRLEIYDLLPRVRRYEASDMRDKIYSILAISCDYDEKDLKPDYSKSTSEIYTGLVRYLIERDRKLEILAYCTATRNIEGLPSWVPDWSYKNVPMPFPRRSFNACANVPSRVSFQNWGSSIRCKGVHIAPVHAVGPARDEATKGDTDQSTLSQSWFTFGMLSLSHNIYHCSYEERLDALRHVVCADVFEWDNSVKRNHTVAWPSENSSHRFEFSKLDFIADSDMDKATSLRRLMWLDNDLLGIGPAEASPGDLVSVLGGLQVPLVLRKVQEHFIIVGECYIHGIMDGEKSWEGGHICDIDIW